MNEMRFENDVVIVTGAGRGLGREHALAFARRGAAVVVNDADHDVATAVAAEITAAGGRAIGDSHSVASQAGADSIVRSALDRFNKVTVLVNNAGIISFAPFAEIEDAVWRRMVAVTLDGTYYMTRAVWPHFMKQAYGRVVNTTSNAGFAGHESLVHYGAAKLGVAGLTKALAHEGLRHGITVNAVAPMAVTRMNRDAFFAGKEVDEADWKESIRKGIVPMGPASVISPTVLWLAHSSTQVNGHIYSTSSGKVARVGFVVGEGYFNPDHSPEDLRDNQSAIDCLGNYLDPRGTVDELAAIPALFAAKL